MIRTLVIVEKLNMDRNRMTELGIRLGPIGADNLISQALEELAVQLAKVHRAFKRSHLSEVRIASEKIVAVSAHIGMAGLSKVASDTANLTTANDGAALAATIARLARIGEASLMADWDLQDLSV